MSVEEKNLTENLLCSKKSVANWRKRNWILSRLVKVHYKKYIKFCYITLNIAFNCITFLLHYRIKERFVLSFTWQICFRNFINIFYIIFEKWYTESYRDILHFGKLCQYVCVFACIRWCYPISYSKQVSSQPLLLFAYSIFC